MLIAQGSMVDLAGASGGIELELVELVDHPDQVEVTEIASEHNGLGHLVALASGQHHDVEGGQRARPAQAKIITGRLGDRRRRAARPAARR